MHCKACNHEWMIPIGLPMPIDNFVALSKGVVAAGCPKCGKGGDNVLVGPARVKP